MWESIAVPMLQAIGGAMDRKFAVNQANKERRAQMAFAKHGIRWKVADARAAGLHPLAALGVSTHGYKPVSVGQQGGLKSMGQALARVNLADMRYKEALTRNVEAQTKALQEKGQADAVTGNPVSDHFNMDIAPGEGRRGMQKHSRTFGQTKGLGPAQANAARPDGFVLRHVPEAIADALESDIVAQTQNVALNAKQYVGAWRNWFFTAWKGYRKRAIKDLEELARFRPSTPPPKGMEYRYNVGYGAFRLAKIDRPGGLFFDHGVPWSVDIPNKPWLPSRTYRERGYNLTNYPKAKPWRLRKSH